MSKTRLPIDVGLPENILLPNNTLFVRLKTLEEVKEFWNANKARFSFVACCDTDSENWILNPHEWVFGQTKEDVVSTVFRWSEIGIECTWKSWDSEAIFPEWPKVMFAERDAARKKKIAANTWNEKDELEYQKDCEERNLDTYKGIWMLKNLPNGILWYEWLPGSEEIFDPELPKGEVEKQFKRETFDKWNASGVEEVDFMTAQELEDWILYWDEERVRGRGYYGEPEPEELMVAE